VSLGDLMVSIIRYMHCLAGDAGYQSWYLCQAHEWKSQKVLLCMAIPFRAVIVTIFSEGRLAIGFQSLCSRTLC
jgi:hypothetical protein